MMWANISHCPRKMAAHEQRNDSELSVINSGEETGHSNSGFECLDSNSGKVYWPWDEGVAFKFRNSFVSDV